MAVTVPADVLARYRAFSCYNSPYAAHERGCAIDLYPDPGTAPSPVAGEVVDVRTVRAPPKSYAPEHDHLVLVDTGDRVARILHVDPAVETGDAIAVGDPLGETVRAGFFAPWVDDHLHLGFRERGANPYRASGSLPVEPGVAVDPLDWDGTGTVVETGDTYAVLDAPPHPAPGEQFVGLAVDGRRAVLDGGLPHYDWGGLLGGSGRLPGGCDGPVSLLGRRVGTADGRHVAWNGVEVRANGTRITGLSLFAARESFGAKLICPDWDVEVGERVEVTVG